MKKTSKDEAKCSAKAQSLEKDFKDLPVYIIYCKRTNFFYVDTISLVRMWEQLIGYYINGVFTPEKKHS